MDSSLKHDTPAWEPKPEHSFHPHKNFDFFAKHAHAGHVLEMVLDYILLVCLSLATFYPIFLVILNSFKNRYTISKKPFDFLTSSNFVGWKNYISGVNQSKFWNSFANTVYITVISVILIILFSAMAAWYLTRVKTWWSKAIYYILVFSMIVPFQMVMLPLTGVYSWLIPTGLDTSWGYLYKIFLVVFVYVGYGAGLSTFIFSGFIEGIPKEIEEAAVIDGCNTPQVFFRVDLPLLKPVTVTVAVLNVMWIWNDFLLPYLLLGTVAGQTTLPVAIQIANQGGYGDRNMGAFMAMIVLAIIPVIAFYLLGQKYIIKGVTSGAVKG
jgi:raffinose/stachyose/melibiose transport system permease protein